MLPLDPPVLAPKHMCITRFGELQRGQGLAPGATRRQVAGASRPGASQIGPPPAAMRAPARPAAERASDVSTILCFIESRGGFGHGRATPSHGLPPHATSDTFLPGTHQSAARHANQPRREERKEQLP